MKHKEIDPKPQFFDRYINLVEDIELLDALGFRVVGHAIHHQNIIKERYLPLLNR